MEDEILANADPLAYYVSEVDLGFVECGARELPHSDETPHGQAPADVVPNVEVLAHDVLAVDLAIRGSEVRKTLEVLVHDERVVVHRFVPAALEVDAGPGAAVRWSESLQK